MAGTGDKLLTAAEIKEVTDTKVNTSDIVNVLNSTSINKPLSAAQGKALNDGKVNKTDTIAIEHGGTNATTAAAARTNLDVYSKSQTDNLVAQSTAGSKTIVGTYTSTVTLPEISIIGFLVHDYGGTVSAYALYGSRCDLIAGTGGITTDGNTSRQTLTFPREGTNRILFIYK